MILPTRKFYKRVALLSIFVGLGILSYCVYLSIKSVNLLEKSTTYTIGIVDGILLKQQAKCFSVHQETAKMLNNVFNKVRISEQKIKTEYEQVKINKKLKPKQKQQEISNIEKKWKIISADYNKQVEEIRMLDAKLMNYINEALNSALSEISKELNLTLIINKGTENYINVFYNVPRMDITAQLVKALDKKLVNFSVKSVS